MAVPDRVWRDEGVLDALARWDFGLLSRRVRERGSLRQEDMAELTGLSQGFLSMLESGSRRLTNIDRVMDFLDGLGVPSELLRLPLQRSHGPVRDLDTALQEDLDPALPWTTGRMVAALENAVRGESMERRRFLAMSGIALTAQIHHWSLAEAEPVARAQDGSRVTPELVDHFQGTIDHLRHLDAVGGSGSLASLASAHLSLLLSTLERARYDEATGRRLAGIAADTATQLGWFHFDAGRHAASQRALLAALRAAHMSGDTRLGAGVLSYVAIQSYSTGHPRDAVGAARAARERTRSAGTPALHAMLLTRQARGHAKLGEREECLRALGQASELCAGGRSENDPQWLYWINEGEIHGQTGSCFLDLGEPGRAADSFALAYDAMNPGETRTRALFQARAATAQLRNGEHEEGRATAERAVTLAERVQSARLNDHLTDVAEELRDVRNTPDAGDLLDRMATLTTKGNR
ncbi:helix-turn-helix domain-containing protein [Streptomyces mangrovi]|uniref:helix-turn-helix domain-containing protein n=1 Tax=Streptomyces mangrovi TaxID=1206892 RepID=UPI00399CB0EB